MNATSELDKHLTTIYTKLKRRYHLVELHITNGGTIHYKREITVNRRFSAK